MLEAAKGETSVELARAVAEVCDVSLAKHEFGNYIVQKLLTLKHEPAAADSRKAYMVPNMSSYSADECFAECNLLDRDE